MVYFSHLLFVALLVSLIVIPCLIAVVIIVQFINEESNKWNHDK